MFIKYIVYKIVSKIHKSIILSVKNIGKLVANPEFIFFIYLVLPETMSSSPSQENFNIFFSRSNYTEQILLYLLPMTSRILNIFYSGSNLIANTVFQWLLGGYILVLLCLTFFWLLENSIKH